MQTGFEFKINWSDIHLFKVSVSAWNGQFGGVAEVYVSIGAFEEAAMKLAEFPKNLRDVRELDFGAFGPESAGGAVSMRFFCVDKSGHIVVESKLESDHDSSGKAQSTQLFVTTEAAAIDRFVQELRTLEATRKGTARLVSSGQ